MDVRAQGSWRKRPDGPGRGSAARARRSSTSSQGQWIGVRLGEWQAQEVRLARGFGECRGLSKEQLEDIYQETSVALLTRRYESEEHLRNALRTGIKHRALNHHRDERRRGQILAYSAPGIYALAQAGAGEAAPESAALSRQDRLIVSEFLTELSPVEQRVFWLLAEGLQYRAIAPALGLDKNLARKAARAVERKRERFQLLYDTGRLCGYRARTILALQGGEVTSGELAERAFAHLESCAACRAEHKTNARLLRRSFQGEAAALLPLPAFATGHLTRIDIRLKALTQRVIDVIPAGPGGAREGAIGLFAGGGAIAKATVATLATVAAVAGGIRVSESPVHHRAARHRAHSHDGRASPVRAPIIDAAASANSGSSQVSSSKPRASARILRARASERESGGFDYLGVASEPPHRAVASTAAVTSRSTETAPARRGGTSSSGEFSP